MLKERQSGLTLSEVGLVVSLGGAEQWPARDTRQGASGRVLFLDLGADDTCASTHTLY